MMDSDQNQGRNSHRKHGDQTRPMEEQVKQLEARIAQLKEENRALLRKNAELERLNKIFIHREFRIRELKAEIERLRKKTGNHDPSSH